MKLINYHLAGTDRIVELEAEKDLINRYLYLCLLQWVRATGTKKEFMKWITINGMAGSSWWFKRFERLSVTVTSANTNSTILS